MDNFDQWMQNITSSSGADSGNIYQNYARTGTVNNTPAAVAGNVAGANAKIDEIKQQNEDAAKDPGKARMVLLPNNQGYAFYDGTGKQISINDFSLITGKRPDQLLADSPNPKDQKFVQDYRTLMAFTSAWVNGDKDTLSKLKAADPQHFNSLVSTYKSPSDVINAFTQHWSDYYSPNPSAGNQSFTTGGFAPNPALNPVGGKALSALEGGTLQQVMNPKTPAAPRPLTFLEKLNPFSGQKDAINRYKTSLQSDPWAAYQSALSGNQYGVGAFNSLVGK